MRVTDTKLVAYSTALNFKSSSLRSLTSLTSISSGSLFCNSDSLFSVSIEFAKTKNCIYCFVVINSMAIYFSKIFVSDLNNKKSGKFVPIKMLFEPLFLHVDGGDGGKIKNKNKNKNFMNEFSRINAFCISDNNRYFCVCMNDGHFVIFDYNTKNVFCVKVLKKYLINSRLK